MFLAFEKWHGCLNDFVVLWISDADGDVVLASLKRQAPQICDRRGGIGADGLLVLRTERRDDLTPGALTIINSDGSLAMNCGNGLRCAALSIRKAHVERGNPKELPEAVSLTVAGDSFTCRFMGQGLSPFVAVEMGIPKLNERVSWHQDALSAVQAIVGKAGVSRSIAEVGTCEIGNPHVVIASEAATRDLLLKLAPELQARPLSDGINVHLVRTKNVTNTDQTRAKQEVGGALGELYDVFVWERGAGETMACGSGAVAVGALALQSGFIKREEWIGVDMPGGRLYVKQATSDDTVRLAGPATYVFRGELLI